MSGPPSIRIVLWNDGGEALAAAVEDEEQKEVLRSYAALVSDALDTVLELPQFRHVEAVQVEDAAEGGPSTLSIGFDTPSADGDVNLDKLSGLLDIAGLLLGSAKLPAEMTAVAEVAITDEEMGQTELQFSDEALAKNVAMLVKRARLERRYTDWLKTVEERLIDALDAASASVEVTETPLDPFDLIQAVVAHLARVADLSPLPPSLLSRGGQLVGRVLGAPRAALRTFAKRARRAQRLWWRLEDLVVDGGKVALKVALRAARPVFVGIVLHRVLKTLDRSRSLEVQLGRMSPLEARDHYYATVLGPDWKQQLQEDLDKACRDVDEGLVTDEINHEKRLVTAAQIRRLEVEEWDKERMKNFYLASFGGLNWFARMEEALHNPLFIESRGWTDPVQNWVGENRTYMADLPTGQVMSDVGQLAVRIKEAELGRALTEEEKAKVLARGAAVAGGLLPANTKGLGAAALAAGGVLVPKASRS